MKYITKEQAKIVLAPHQMTILDIPTDINKSLFVIQPLHLDQIGIHSFQLALVSTGIYKYKSLASTPTDRRKAENNLPARSEGK